MVKNITGSVDLAESLRGKSATFLLALSNTKTAEIKGISQAGIPGMLHLTPTLDAEFVCTGEVRSLENIAETPKGVPTPALMTRAVHMLNPFGNIELLNLGLEVDPDLKYFKRHDFDIDPSLSIQTGASIDAMRIFEKGVAFGQSYKPKNDYVILGESVPSGTTTALTTALALGYNCKDMFSSSFKDAPVDIKAKIVDEALKNINDNMDIFEKLSNVSDNMLIFNAGFILGASQHDYPIVLAGGTQMASVLLIVNSILFEMSGSIDPSKLSLCTTKWVYEDQNSDIEALTDMLDFPLSTYYADFDFSLSTHPALKLYDQGEAKEGVGAGGALMYAFLNGISKEEITRKVESFLG